MSPSLPCSALQTDRLDALLCALRAPGAGRGAGGGVRREVGSDKGGLHIGGLTLLTPGGEQASAAWGGEMWAGKG